MGTPRPSKRMAAAVPRATGIGTYRVDAGRFDRTKTFYMHLSAADSAA